MYRPNALALSTVKKLHKGFQQQRTDLSDDRRPERPVRHDLAEAIQSKFTGPPFMSWPVLGRYLGIGKATRLRKFLTDMGLMQFHLH
jgi:hypothetical protein